MLLHLVNRDEVETPLVIKACKDEAFKKALISDPKGVIEKRFHVKIPADIKITVLQEEVDHFYLVLPPPLPPFSSELRDEELEAVAGGKGDPKPTMETPDPTPAPSCCGLCKGTTTNCPEVY